jgi:error-prone DNA polymerase
VQSRVQQPYLSTEDLALRAGLDAGDLRALAIADALLSLSGHRRQQVWDASALRIAPALLRGAPVDEDVLELPAAPEGEEVVFDYAALGLSLRRHPLALLRPQLVSRRLQSAAELQAQPDGRLVRACGLVIARQQPGTAKGVVFVTLEDESGSVQVIVWKALRERQRRTLLQARLLAVHGTWQRQGEVCHLIAGYLEDLTLLLGDLMGDVPGRQTSGLVTTSRDFR